jgi:uncharacterized SAM-binding protein YcdF (DUF218 family)/glycosyltransferase involved in cell wall biosynthesis
MISILILTRNEEANLPACLDAVKWSDDILVFDSFSTDRTVEIARGAGARIVQREFDNERDHRAASLRLPFKYRWVYNPDADEITPPDLRDELLRVVAGSDRPVVAYRVRSRTIFRGRWIRHSSLYPTWFVRLFQPDKISFERSIHLSYLVQGAEGRLLNHLEHHTFNKGIAAWIEKHNRYSTQEAIESLQSLSRSGFPWRDLLRGPVLRRRALKELSFRLPCRPLSRFIYMYFVRLGFLDGGAGWDYCLLLSMYEKMIMLKMDEFRRARGDPDPKKISSYFTWCRARFFLSILLGALLALVAAGYVFAAKLLCIESGPHRADVIIVLGGESEQRARRALELFQAGAAPGIIVSGDGDAFLIVRQLIQGGVPAGAIQMEDRSKNTKENAEFTVRLLKKEGVQRAIIVTSWFHSRRALNTFSFFAPEIRFSSLPTYHQAWPAEAVHIYQEYPKTVWYYFHYGIAPWRATSW